MSPHGDTAGSRLIAVSLCSSPSCEPWPPGFATPAGSEQPVRRSAGWPCLPLRTAVTGHHEPVAQDKRYSLTAQEMCAKTHICRAMSLLRLLAFLGLQPHHSNLHRLPDSHSTQGPT
jgi:hypothetical protein